MKRFLIFFLIGFGVFLLSTSSCFAIDAPTNLSPCGGSSLGQCPPDSGKPCLNTQLEWSDVGAHHYELYYKEQDEIDWTDKYPATTTYSLRGLSPNTTYEWYVVSCGDKDCSVSADSAKCSFFTEQFAPQEENGDGGGNGDGFTPSPTQPLINPLLVETICDLLDKLINFLFMLALGIAPIVLIVAGIYMLSGNPEKVKRAKQILLWAAIALTIVFLAKGLPAVIKGALGG